jgi:hypothetical protein
MMAAMRDSISLTTTRSRIHSLINVGYEGGALMTDEGLEIIRSWRPILVNTYTRSV